MTPRATAPALRLASPSGRAALAAAFARSAALVAVLTVLAGCAGTRPAPAPAPVPAPVDAAPTVAIATPQLDSAVRAIRERLLADSGDPVRPILPVPRYALDVDVTPYESDDRVSRYVTLFTGEGRERFAARLERGTRYDAMIRRRLRDAGLPEDLTYLALVESGYDPHAVSRASAVGMWQFMAETARVLGLRVDWWVDERRDPVKATDAAVRNLRWLRKEFGSLFLAAAAYNGGPGRVGRGLAQLAALSDSSEGEARFFALAEGGLLRTETVNYVPQIIAASLVAGEPERYGIAVRPLSPFTYDTVFVGALTPLAAVADAARTTREELLDLNPQLLRGMTPPGQATLVRVPVGTAAGFSERLADLPSKERRAFRSVATKAGETVDRIAARERVPAAEIRRFNGKLAVVKKGKRKGTLVAGQTLRIPTAAVLAYARPIGDVDGDARPTGLPAPTVAAAAKGDAAPVRATEDGGDVEPDASKPPKGTAKPASKAAAKGAAKGAAKSSARSAAKSATKNATKSAARGSKATATAKGATKSAAKASSKSAAKPSVKSAVKASSKSSAKGASKTAGTAKAKPAATKKSAEAKKTAGKPAASSKEKGGKSAGAE